MTSADLAQAAQLAEWREAQALDLPFIFNSWLNSYRDAPDMEGVPARTYFAGQHDLVTRLLHRARVLIACDRQRPDDIWGYVVFEPPSVAHYVYVKSAFRRFGIATALCERAGIRAAAHSHRTLSGRLLAKKLQSTFNPFLAR